MKVQSLFRMFLPKANAPTVTVVGLMMTLMSACGSDTAPQAPTRRPQNLAAAGNTGNAMGQNGVESTSSGTKSCTEKSCPSVSPTVSLGQIDGQMGSTFEHVITASASASDRVFKVFPSTKEKPFQVTETVQGNELKISGVGNREILQGFYYVVVRDMDACTVKNSGVAARCQSLGSFNSEYDFERPISVKIASNQVANNAQSSAEDLRAAVARCRASQPPRPNAFSSILGAFPAAISGFASGNTYAGVAAIASGIGRVISNNSRPEPSVTSCE